MYYVTVPSIVQTHSVDSCNFSIIDIIVSVDDSPNRENEEFGCDTVEETIKLTHCVTLTSWNSRRESRKWP